GAALGEDDAFDQGIHRRILDAPDIARTGPVRRRRAEPVALFVARRQRLSPDRRGDVEIETAHTILVLHAVDGAYVDGHAEPLEIWLVEKHSSLVTLVLAQEFDADRLARGIDQLAITHFVAG